MNQTLLHDSSSLGHGLDYAGPELVMAAVSLASQGWLVLAACGSIAQGDRKWPLLLLVTASTQHCNGESFCHLLDFGESLMSLRRLCPARAPPSDSGQDNCAAPSK